MPLADTSQAHGIERDALLGRITAMLREDERVTAAWLYGSLGRGTSDEWSDIDLWVVVEDKDAAAVQDARRETVALVSDPLLVLDVPQNAPAGGAFMSVVYRGETGGPQHVDWTWQPQATAHVPNDAKVLFNRAGVPDAPLATPSTPKEHASKAAHQTRYFWMMLPIVTKYIVRRQPWQAVHLLALLRYTLDEISWLLGIANGSPDFPTRSSVPPPAEPEAQLTLLKQLAGEMEGLMSRDKRIGEEVSVPARAQILGVVDAALGS